MKQLLMLVLSVYYGEMKRQTAARTTRKLDADIRALTKDKPEMIAVVADAKKIADASKARRRRNSGKPPKKLPARPRPDVEHIPCRRSK